MGTWGTGNLDSDAAADHLEFVCAPMVRQIAEAMGDEKRIEPGEYDADAVMVNLEVLACLGENLACQFNLPDPITIASWKRTFLKIWDEMIDDLDPGPEYKVERRRIIAATFDRVEGLSREFRQR